MPGFSKNADALATKLVSVYPDLPESHIATVLLFDATTGKLNAVCLHKIMNTCSINPRFHLFTGS